LAQHALPDHCESRRLRADHDMTGATIPGN